MPCRLSQFPTAPLTTTLPVVWPFAGVEKDGDVDADEGGEVKLVRDVDDGVDDGVDDDPVVDEDTVLVRGGFLFPTVDDDDVDDDCEPPVVAVTAEGGGGRADDLPILVGSATTFRVRAGCGSSKRHFFFLRTANTLDVDVKPVTNEMGKSIVVVDDDVVDDDNSRRVVGPKSKKKQ